MAVLNPSFEDAGLLPGEAEHWTLVAVASLEAIAGFGAETSAALVARRFRRVLQRLDAHSVAVEVPLAPSSFSIASMVTTAASNTECSATVNSTTPSPAARCPPVCDTVLTRKRRTSAATAGSWPVVSARRSAGDAMSSSSS